MAEREQTTMSIWRSTLTLLDTLCQTTGRTRQQQINYWAEREARRIMQDDKQEEWEASVVSRLPRK